MVTAQAVVIMQVVHHVLAALLVEVQYAHKMDVVVVGAAVTRVAVMPVAEMVAADVLEAVLMHVVKMDVVVV
jgi:hypothetical protein